MKDFFHQQFFDLCEIRQKLHQHPELGFEEVSTAAVIEEELIRLKLPFKKGMATTGIVVTIKGNAPDTARRIGLRADMDALPIHELSSHDHTSEVDNCMHACGHDGHTTMLLGVARYLAAHRDNFGGIIYLIFQPAEEGLGGGRVMVEEGLFSLFPMDAVYGLHNWPHLQLGKFGVCDGAILAATDKINLKICGKGGHGGANHHLTIDPIRVAGTLIPALNSIISRDIDPQASAVLSLCAIEGGNLDAFAVIPENVNISGTVRTFDPIIQNQIEESINRVCNGVASTYGANIEVDYQRIFPATINSSEPVDHVRKTVKELFGDNALDNDVTASFGGEDFSFLLEKCPGAYFFLGTGDDNHTAPLHNAYFDFNDKAIPLGCELLTELALRSVNQK